MQRSGGPWWIPQGGFVPPADIVGMGESPLPTVFRFLAAEENLALDAALVEALPHMDSAAQPVALKSLTERGHLPSQVSLIGTFRGLGEPLRAMVVEHVGGLFGAARTAVDSPVLEHRVGAIELIVASRCGPLTYLLADALRHRCNRTRELAARALQGLTAGLLDRFEREASVSEIAALGAVADGLADALRRGVLTWELHHKRQVLEAALWMSDQVAGAIRKKLEEPRTKIGHAISEILQGASDPRLAGFALRALAMPTLRSSAVSAIGRATAVALRRAVVARSWLLVDPEIERGCRWIRDSRWLHKSVDELVELGHREAAEAVPLLCATGGPHERKIELLSELLKVGSDELKTAVGWQLVNDDSEAATDLLGTLADRCSGEMGRIAARELDRRRPPAPRPTHQELPEDGFGHLAARRAFERYWEEFDRLEPDERAAVTDAMREIGGAVLIPIREKLASGRAADRSRALRIARALGLTNELEEQVYRLRHDPDPFVRSTAVSALADLPGPTSRRILRQALGDPDDRVQANAIEALEVLGGEGRLSDTASKLNSRNARVRGNAVKSLLGLELQEAGVALIEMLGDSSRAHRISALWVVERLGLRAVLDRIEEISRNDPDRQVRQRARRVLEQLGPGHHDRGDSGRGRASDDRVGSALEAHL